jgi:hypothetical protein
MSDFIREVDEEYRRERLVSFLRRYQVLLVLLAVVVVAGAGGWRWYVDRQDSRAAAANVRLDEAAALARDGNVADAEAAYGKLAGDGPKGYAVLARLRQAELQGIRDPKAAATALDAIADGNGFGSPVLGDLARFRGAVLRLDDGDLQAFQKRYGGYAQESFTFHDGMRELLALAAMKRNDFKAAGSYLDEIAIDPLAPPALRSRAQAFRELVAAGPAQPIAAAPGPARVTPLPSAPVSEPAPLPQAAPVSSAAAPAPVAPH